VRSDGDGAELPQRFRGVPVVNTDLPAWWCFREFGFVVRDFGFGGVSQQQIKSGFGQVLGQKG